jgi:hypothetical protein
VNKDVFSFTYVIFCFLYIAILFLAINLSIDLRDQVHELNSITQQIDEISDKAKSLELKLENQK